MPKIQRSDAAELSVEDLKAKVSENGIGDCLWDLVKADRIEDPKLQDLWRAARAAMLEVFQYLDRVERRKKHTIHINRR